MIMTVSKSLTTFAAMVGVFVLCINCFGIVYMVRYEVLGADNQEMELKRSRSSQN
jgi:hypothetical protein